MKHLVTIPKRWTDYLRQQGPTALGYQVVSVDLKYGRTFSQVIVSERCVIQVRGWEKPRRQFGFNSTGFLANARSSTT
jgi:hypothetical protein